MDSFPLRGLALCRAVLQRRNYRTALCVRVQVCGAAWVDVCEITVGPANVPAVNCLGEAQQFGGYYESATQPSRLPRTLLPGLAKGGWDHRIRTALRSGHCGFRNTRLDQLLLLH